MQTRRWVNQSQPQTLVIAVFLLYFGAVYVLLGSGPQLGAAVGGSNATAIENLARLFIAVGGVYAGYAIANEQKLGYYIGVAVAALPLVAKALIMVKYRVGPFSFDLVTLLFEVALLALILHTQSRNYVRIWFK